MNLGRSKNSETGQTGYGDQSFNTTRNTQSTVNSHPTQGASHDYSRELSTDEACITALSAQNDGIIIRDQIVFPGQVYEHSLTTISPNAAVYYSASTPIWTHAGSLGDHDRSICQLEFESRVEDSSSDFPPHQYRGNKFPETTPLISAYSNLDKSIDTISPLGLGVDSIVQAIQGSECSETQSTINDTHASSCPVIPSPALALLAQEYIPSPTPTQLGQSTFGFKALEYQAQALTPAPHLLTRRKRKIALDKYGDGSEIHVQKRNDEIDRPLKAITDEAFPFQGCFVLAPTSPDGKTYPAGMPPKRRSSKQKPPRKPMAMEDRAAVKQNRITGVCVRCKMFKEKCRGGFPCQRCCELKIWKTICVTSQLVGKHVFSRGLYRARATQLCRIVVQNWNDEDTAPARIVEISNGYAPILSLEVHEFQPKNRHMLDHIVWQGSGKSNRTSVSSTPYGLKTESNLLHQCDQYIDALLPGLVQELEHEIGQNVYSQTIKTAYQYNVKNVSLLQMALRIWAIHTLFFNRRWRISCTSGDNLGMSAITDSSQLFGVTLLPKLLEQQLESILECRAAELEQCLLGEVQNMIFRRYPGEWFTTFLTIFVFLNALEKDTWNLETLNMEAISDRDIEGEDSTLAWPLSDTPPSSLIEKNVALADVLAAHFRSVTRGNIPFTRNWRSDLLKQMASNPDAVDYMETTGELITSSTTFLRAKRLAYYCREDENSLSLKFSSKLLINEDEESE